MPSRTDVAVVGGGAAGLAAAIASARGGDSVIVCERMPRPGKKILVTGGGRCNLSNDALSPAAFTSSDPVLVGEVLGHFSRDDILRFFGGLGLETVSENGRVFPATNQAASVLKVLELEVRRLGVALELGFEATRVMPLEPGFRVEGAEGRSVEAGTVILAGGGRSYPALGSNGSGYALAAALGHSVVKPVPSAVPLLVRDRLCHLLQGQKVRASATALVGGRPAARAEGEVLFTQYGLSGTAALDVSECLSVALNREGRADADIVLDLVPFMGREALAAELCRRLEARWGSVDLVSGILPEKFGPYVAALARESEGGPARRAEGFASALKGLRFPVQGTRGWNEAEFTCGGIDAREIDPQALESKLCPGLFLAGEILDVQGGRGGYNLAWAWASGYVAGRRGR